MSTSQIEQLLDAFRQAKAEFLRGAHAATVVGGLIQGVQAMDEALADILEMGVNAGLTPTNQELYEMAGLSRLLSQAEITSEEWYSPTGINAVEFEATLTGLAHPTAVPSSATATTEDADLPPEGVSSVSNSEQEESSHIAMMEDIQATSSTEPSHPPRPTTSGKSLDLLDTYLAPKRKRVTLKLGAHTEAEEDVEEYQDDTDDLADESGDEMEIDVAPKPNRTGRATRKRRRIVSAATIPSGDESEDAEVERKPSRRRIEDDGWETFLSPTPCGYCAKQGFECRRYVRRAKGHQRHACASCRYRKRYCDFVEKGKTRRRQASQYRELSEDSDASDAVGRQAWKMGASRGKRAQTKFEDAEELSEDAEDVKVRRRERRQGKERQREREKEKERSGKKGEGKGKGKGKGKSKEKGKGKARAKSESFVAEDAAVKLEDEEETEWFTVQGNSAGPSGGQIRRRPQESPRDIAELYGRLRAMEDNAETLVQATAVSMQEMRGQIDRVDSNQDTQKKYFEQQLARVGEMAETALERTAGIQDQVDSVRQQTRDMHDSLSSMQRHSELLTTGLTEMIQGFKDLRFEMPNRFDDWLKVRLGGHPSTINTGEAEHRWNVPSIPASTSQAAPRAVPTDPAHAADDKGNTSSSTSRPSSTELYRLFLKSSQENLSVHLKSGDEEEMKREGQAQGENAQVEDTEAEEANAEGAEDRTDAGKPDAAEDGAAELRAEATVEEVPTVQKREDAGKEEPDEGEVEEPLAGDSAAAPMASENDAPTSSTPTTFTSHGDVHPVEAHPDGMEPSEMAGIEEGEVASAPSPISSGIILSANVDPPAGLLSTTNWHLSPPSSQAPMSSPTPQPDHRLLGVPGPSQSRNTAPTGPITRSRSRSRSPHSPALIDHCQNLIAAKGKSRRKRQK